MAGFLSPCCRIAIRNEEGRGRGEASNHHIMDLPPAPVDGCVKYSSSSGDSSTGATSSRRSGDQDAAKKKKKKKNPGQVFVPSELEIQAGFRATIPDVSCYTFTEWGWLAGKSMRNPTGLCFSRPAGKAGTTQDDPVISIEAADRRSANSGFAAMCEPEGVSGAA